MDELIAWAEKQVELWKAEVALLEERKIRLEHLDAAGEWVDQTASSKGKLKERLAQLQGTLGRVRVGVVVEAPKPIVDPLSGGLD